MDMRILIGTLVFSLAAHHAIAQVRLPAPVETSRSVTMTLAEYNRLLDQAAKVPVATPSSPVAAVVSSADLRITVDRESAHGVFTLTGQVLQSGIHKVPMVTGATIIDATAGGRPVPLIAEGDALQALITGPAPFALNLEWGGPLLFRPGRASFAMPVPQAGAARVSIDLPGEQADVHLSSGLITRRSVANGRTLIEATLDPGAPTEVWWSMRDSAVAAAVKDVRALADVMTLITLDEADVRMVALIDVNVTQGELRTLTIQVPNGYQLQSVSGNTLAEYTAPGDEVVLTIANPAARSHQFLVNLEREHQGGTFNLESGVVTIKNVQRERGEVAIEGVGTMDVTAEERPGLHRIDVRELNTSLHSLARWPVLSAFRYQRPAESAAPILGVAVKRFADAGVLAAAADRATATTLITSEGRALTEVQLEIRNRSQAFLKVDLPAGATIVSVELAGRSAKPASDQDGIRIPLMRAGLSMTAPYTVSFVYVHAGTPFQKKGDIEMSLPKMDVPIGIVQWELFVPDQYRASAIDGNVIDARRFPAMTRVSGEAFGGDIAPSRPMSRMKLVTPVDVLSGQIRGQVVDNTHSVLPGVSVEIKVGSYVASMMSDSTGGFTFSNVPGGEVLMASSLAGFDPNRATFSFDGTPRRVEVQMQVSTLAETITVTAAQPVIDTSSASISQNIVNLQQRTAGVLPIRVDVPRAGVSHQFIKPLVVGTEATVKLRYKRN